MKIKRARISMAIQWTSGTRDTVLELQKRIGNSWNFHGIFCIKVSSGWMFLMSPWCWLLLVTLKALEAWKHWEWSCGACASRVCSCCNVSNFVGKSMWFLWFQWLQQVCHWKPNSNGWSAASEGGASGASFVKEKVTGNDFRPRNLNSFEISWTTRLI